MPQSLDTHQPQEHHSDVEKNNVQQLGALEKEITAELMNTEYPANIVGELLEVVNTTSHQFDQEDRDQFESDIESFYKTLPSGGLESEIARLELESDEFINMLPKDLQANFNSWFEGKRVDVDLYGIGGTIAPTHVIDLYQAITKREFIRRAVPVLNTLYKSGAFTDIDTDGDNYIDMSEKFTNILKDADVNFNLHHINVEELD